MSAFGPKRTFHYVAFDVAFGGKADMTLCGSGMLLRKLTPEPHFASRKSLL